MKKTYKHLAILLALFNILDAAFTSVAVAAFGAENVEQNPVMRWVLLVGGIRLFLTIKAVGLGVAGWFYWRDGSTRAIRVCAWTITTFYAGIVGWWVIQFWVP